MVHPELIRRLQMTKNVNAVACLPWQQCLRKSTIVRHFDIFWSFSAVVQSDRIFFGADSLVSGSTMVAEETASLDVCTKQHAPLQ